MARPYGGRFQFVFVVLPFAARLGADRHCDDGSRRWWNLLGMPVYLRHFWRNAENAEERGSLPAERAADDLLRLLDNLCDGVMTMPSARLSDRPRLCIRMVGS